MENDGFMYVQFNAHGKVRAVPEATDAVSVECYFYFGGWVEIVKAAFRELRKGIVIPLRPVQLQHAVGWTGLYVRYERAFMYI